MSVEITKEEEDRYVQLQLIALDFARAGNVVELQNMISHGISVNLCTHKDDTLLMLSTYNGHLEASKMLIEEGADMNRVNQRGQTPLEGVCFKGNLEIVKLLVESGAKITPNSLVFATIFGNKNIVEFLKKQDNVPQKRIWGIDVDSLVFITAKIKSLSLIFKINHRKDRKYNKSKDDC